MQSGGISFPLRRPCCLHRHRLCPQASVRWAAQYSSSVNGLKVSRRSREERRALAKEMRLHRYICESRSGMKRKVSQNPISLYHRHECFSFLLFPAKKQAHLLPIQCGGRKGLDGSIPQIYPRRQSLLLFSTTASGAGGPCWHRRRPRNRCRRSWRRRGLQREREIEAVERYTGSDKRGARNFCAGEKEGEETE